MGHLEPRQYQLRGVDFWIANPRTYFAVDMGLGKTLISLLGLKKIGVPALIVAPIRTVYSSWPEEIEKSGTGLTYSIVYGPDKLQALIKKADVYLTNFETLPFLYEHLQWLAKMKKPMPFSACIIDEGSMIKSSDTMRFRYLKAMRPLFPKYRAILSGTPAPNSYEDLWSQYYWLTDGKALGAGITAFRSRYFQKAGSFKWVLRPGAAEEIMKAIAPYTFRLSAEDFLKLPLLIKNTVPLIMPPDLKKQYDTLESEFMLQLGSIEHQVFNSASLSMKLRQFLQGAMYYPDPVTGAKCTQRVHDLKYKALQEIVDQSSTPVLATIQFRFELEQIQKIYPDAAVVAGGTSSAKAAEYFREWNKGNIPLLLCHPASLSHGVNLQTGGHTIVWCGMTWSLEQYLQLNARLRRSGQINNVIVHHLIFKDTIDEVIYEAVAKKNMSQKELLDYLRDYCKNI
jgi:SNF2 family DNA or RNA helicase